MRAVVSPTVLVVEDEPLIRMSTIELVEDAGFSAIEAVNADAALCVLNQRPDIKVLMTDIDMPGSINGLELANIVSRTWPSIGIIVVSGYMRASADQVPVDGVFLPKPYDFNRVETELKRLTAHVTR